MEDKYEIMRSLVSALENTTQMLHDSINKHMELGKMQIDAMRHQCEENTKLIKEMWEELKKEKN
jgi:hypothetical protein